MDVGGPDFQGKSRESGTGADVEHAGGTRRRGENSWIGLAGVGGVGVLRLRQDTCFARVLATLRMTGVVRMIRIERCREEVSGQEKGFAEVAGYDFLFVADGGQVDAGVPAE